MDFKVVCYSISEFRFSTNATDLRVRWGLAMNITFALEKEECHGRNHCNLPSNVLFVHIRAVSMAVKNRYLLAI